MKKVILVFSLLVSFAISVSAQTMRFLPDPTAQLVATEKITIHIDLGSDGKPFVSAQVTSKDVSTEIGWWRTSGGRIEPQLTSDSIRYIGTPEVIDNTPTSAIYTWLTMAAVNRGVQRGFIPPADCSMPWMINAYSEACVNRMGTGMQTRFVPCDRVNYSTWKYSVCYSAGDTLPTINRLPFYNPVVCDTYCEPTCPNQGAGSTIQ